MKDLCTGCKKFTEIAYTQSGTEQPFCIDCAPMQPPIGDERAAILLTDPRSPFSAPFKPGDTVEVRQAIPTEADEPQFRTEGVGEVIGMSMSWEHGATPVYPTFKVTIKQKAHDEAPDEGWFPEICLQKVG